MAGGTLKGWFITWTMPLACFKQNKSTESSADNTIPTVSNKTVMENQADGIQVWNYQYTLFHVLQGVFAVFPNMN